MKPHAERLLATWGGDGRGAHGATGPRSHGATEPRSPSSRGPDAACLACRLREPVRRAMRARVLRQHMSGGSWA